MTKLIITLDLDWACEAAIEETIQFFLDKHIPLTVFTTHHSKIINTSMSNLDVGLHPFFGENSSHGNSVTEVVKSVMEIPHNLKAFRCHRFGVCNLSKQALVEAGMLISSNVCTHLEDVTPFQDRFGLLEIPIFFEDGGYLWRNEPLNTHIISKKILAGSNAKVLLIHPMHFVINTPHFNYMQDIKNSVNRKTWNHLSSAKLKQLRWKGRGIQDFIIELLGLVSETDTLRSLYHSVSKEHDHL